MKLQVLIPTGCWKVDIDSTNDHNTIRLSGSVLSDGQWRTEKKIQIIYLTHEQARELVEGLHRALREFELQRSASLARVARGEGVADWTIRCPGRITGCVRLPTRLLLWFFAKRMIESTTPDSHDLCDVNVLGTWPMPVHAWRTDSTAQSIALRAPVDSPIDPSGVYAFALEPEQTRQFIRDLSAAILHSDVKRTE